MPDWKPGVTRRQKARWLAWQAVLFLTDALDTVGFYVDWVCVATGSVVSGLLKLPHALAEQAFHRAYGYTALLTPLGNFAVALLCLGCLVSSVAFAVCLWAGAWFSALVYGLAACATGWFAWDAWRLARELNG